MVANGDTLLALSRSDSFGVHSVFAGLYASSNRHLLAYFDTMEDPAFCYLSMIRFYDLYDRLVTQPILHGRGVTAPHWLRYSALASRLTVASSVNALLWLLSLGARAHVCHDLGEAIRMAVADHRRLFGGDPDFGVARAALLGKATSEAFFAATLEFNVMHRATQRGWRRFMLGLHAGFARLSRPFWLAVLQSWRRAAWDDAMATLR